MATLTDVLGTVGVRAFGVGMPVIAKRWTDGTMPTLGTDELSLELSGGSWVAPLPGTVRRLDAAPTGVTLSRGSGIAITGPGVLLTLFPQVELRLARLSAQVLEDGTGTVRPGRALGRPARPVPRHWFFAGAPGTQDGHLAADDPVGQAGTLSIHDPDGQPIDPLAVAAALQAFMVAHQPLQVRGLTDAFTATTQVASIAALAGATPVVRIRLVDATSGPAALTNLTGLTATGTTGLATLNASSGTGSDLTGTIGKVAATGVTGAFPPLARRALVVGLSTTGRLGDSLTFPARPSGVALARDFFTVRVLDLRRVLLGTPDPSFAGTKVEDPPMVRLHEPVDLLADGNDVLAAAGAALAGSPVESIAVGQRIQGGFPVPSAIGAAAHWPQFPTATATPTPGPLAVALRDGFAPTATPFDDGAAATDDVDIVLTLSGLPVEAAVRVYHRRFTADAREERGDGAGGVASAGGTLSLLLRDPLGLRRPGIMATIPADSVLHLDVMVVTRSGHARLYGNVAVPVASGPTTAAPPAAGSNPFSTAARRGITSAGVLGLAATAVTIPPTATALEAATLLAGEGNPRDAPRLPTMARRELLVAGLGAATGGQWRAVTAGGRLDPETHSAQATLGAPGSPGGRETQVVGVATQNGRLAYDLARMGMRRSTDIVTRLTELAKGQWAEPPEATPLPVDSTPTASSGTFAGAVLQSISPFSETPELGILRNVIDPDSTTRPKTFDELVDWVAANLVPGGVPFRPRIIAKLNELKDDTTLDESDKERLFDETEREIMSAGWGRRDAQWALQAAIGRARHSIYIETPGFAPTAKPPAAGGSLPPQAVDLLAALDARITAAPGLQVTICTPRFPDFAPGYERLAAHEAEARRTAILALATAADPEPLRSRVVAFHPLGFPGRPSRLESTVVVVDDTWLLVGSSTVRRRGLTFDGGTDVVLVDLELADGRSPAIAEFRRRLLAVRLGVPVPSAGSVEIPDARWVRLADGAESALVVREMLRAGGLGRIEPLWNGVTPCVPPVSTTGISIDLANPDGMELDLAAILVEATLATLARW